MQYRIWVVPINRLGYVRIRLQDVAEFSHANILVKKQRNQQLNRLCP